MTERCAGAGGRMVTVAVFAAAMAFVESVLVIHLRSLYYPRGFDFPMVEVSAFVYVVEVVREAATVVMLWAVARLASPFSWGRFSFFAFAFGVWDLFYYVWLKALIDWPQSLLTWDVLFLIPVIWAGPVLAPCLVSLLLVAGAAWMLGPLGLEETVRAPRAAWLAGGAGCLVVVATFCAPVVARLADRGAASLLDWVPVPFAWWAFIPGLLGMSAAVVLSARQSRGGGRG